MVNFGIIGLGKWAGVLARAASKSAQIKIIQGFSRSKITQEKFCAEHGVLGVHDATEILENPSIQGVILTVPNELHFAYAEMCAKAGKHVYIEKPIANTLKEAKLLKQVCEQHGVRVFVGHCAKQNIRHWNRSCCWHLGS
jgi:predicted dehydrogenase